MYLGSSNSPATVYQTVTLRDAVVGYSKTVAYPTYTTGDMLLLTLIAGTSTVPSAPDSTWKLYESITSSGLGDNFASALYYKFVPQGMSLVYNLASNMDWMMASFSGVDQAKPFGAYAEAPFAMTSISTGGSMNTPAITMTQPNGKALVVDVLQPKSATGYWSTPGGYTKFFSDVNNDQWAIYRNSRTTAAVASVAVTANIKISGFVHTFEILPSSYISEPGLLTAVYLGTEKIWPEDVTGGFGLTLITNPGDFAFVVPVGATAVDVVFIGGGGGGSGSAGGITPDGDGGGVGAWQSFTAKVGVDVPAGGIIRGNIGGGGANGTALFIGPGNGEVTKVTVNSVTRTATAGQGGLAVQDRTGLTPPPCIFNGRTYPGGAGGNGTADVGEPGESPGGGGQGGKSTATSRAGGPGGSGGVYLYVY